MQPFRKLIASRIYLLTFLETLLATLCYLAAVLLSPVDPEIYLLYESGAQHIGIVAVTYLIVSYLFDFYKQIHVRSRLVLVLQLSHLIGIIIIVQAALAYLKPDLVAPPWVIIGGSALTLAVVAVWRLFLHPAMWKAIGAQRVLFVGASRAVNQLAQAFEEQPALGMEVVSYVQDDSDLNAIVASMEPDRVIVAADGISNKSVLRTLFDLRSAGVTVESAADVYEAIFGRIYSPAVDPYIVIFRNELSARPGSVALQSIYTNLLALIAAVITLPLIALIALALKLTRRGSVLVKHTCTGLHGIPFNRYRFDCETHQQTATSRFLVHSRLEALPQIMNIVRGEMALIGPRSERVEFSEIIDELIPFYRQKHSVKPGVMGWSQLHCDVLPTENTLTRLEYDLYYIKHISLVLDAYILLRALKWALSDRSSREPVPPLQNASAQVKSL